MAGTVDGYIGWPDIQKLNQLDTKAIIKVLETWFVAHGKPMRIRCDGGPQFQQEFKYRSQAEDIQFCQIEIEQRSFY